MPSPFVFGCSFVLEAEKSLPEGHRAWYLNTNLYTRRAPFAGRINDQDLSTWHGCCSLTSAEHRQPLFNVFLWLSQVTCTERQRSVSGVSPRLLQVLCANTIHRAAAAQRSSLLLNGGTDWKKVLVLCPDLPLHHQMEPSLHGKGFSTRGTRQVKACYSQTCFSLSKMLIFLSFGGRVISVFPFDHRRVT